MTKLTKQTAQHVLKLLANGSTIKQAAAAVGVCRQTIAEWIKRGNQCIAERDNGGEIKPDDMLCVSLVRALGRARARGVAKALKAIKAKYDSDWRAAAFFLERSYPEKWGANRLEVKHLQREVQKLRAEVREIANWNAQDDDTGDE